MRTSAPAKTVGDAPTTKLTHTISNAELRETRTGMVVCPSLIEKSRGIVAVEGSLLIKTLGKSSTFPSTKSSSAGEGELLAVLNVEIELPSSHDVIESSEE